jgi:hypothetical protein
MFHTNTDANNNTMLLLNSLYCLTTTVAPISYSTINYDFYQTNSFPQPYDFSVIYPYDNNSNDLNYYDCAPKKREFYKKQYNKTTTFHRKNMMHYKRKY